jgi:hypothetical protein
MQSSPDSGLMNEGFGPAGYGTESFGHVSDVVGGADVAGVAADRAFDAEAGIEGGLEGATDVAGGASSAIPFIGAGLKLGTGALTGKLQKDPGSTIGSAAGGAIGATAGTAIFPGVGTVIGGLLGSMIGGKVGGFIQRPSLESGMEMVKPPSTDPTSMISGLLGGGKSKMVSSGGGSPGGYDQIKDQMTQSNLLGSAEQGTRVIDDDAWRRLLELQSQNLGSDWASMDWYSQ